MHTVSYPDTITLEEYLMRRKRKRENKEKHIDQNCGEWYDTKTD